MKINVRNLKDGRHLFDFEVPYGELDLGEDSVYRHAVYVHSEVDKRGSNIVVTSRVTTRADHECDVCLTPFVREVAEEYRVLYTTEKALVDDEADELIQWIDAGTHEIDLSFGLRDSLILAIPMKVTCTPECKGLCPNCGANLNEGTCACSAQRIDPRWSALQKLSGT